MTWQASSARPMVVADFGCGDAELARSVPQKKVHSFDLESEAGPYTVHFSARRTPFCGIRRVVSVCQ